MAGALQEDVVVMLKWGVQFKTALGISHTRIYSQLRYLPQRNFRHWSFGLYSNCQKLHWSFFFTFVCESVVRKLIARFRHLKAILVKRHYSSTWAS
jgi:hypothetical protein